MYDGDERATMRSRVREDDTLAHSLARMTPADRERLVAGLRALLAAAADESR